MSLPVAPAVFERIFRVIHKALLRHRFASPHRCCTLFSVIGAAILNEAHNIRAVSRSGGAMFELGLARQLAFVDVSSGIYAHSESGFHSWVEADGWFVDLSSPLYPEMVADLDIGECGRRMMQKPMSEEAATPGELSAQRRFCLFPDEAFTVSQINLVLDDDRMFELLYQCINAYTRGSDIDLSGICVDDCW